MARFHFVRDRASNVLEPEMPGFFCDPRMEHHLKQEIAQFSVQIDHIIPIDGIDDFVRLFNRIWSNRCESLHPVPSAAILGVTEAGHDGHEAVNLLH